MHTSISQLPKRPSDHLTPRNAPIQEKQHQHGTRVRRTMRVCPTYLRSQKFLEEPLCVDDQPNDPSDPRQPVQPK